MDSEARDVTLRIRVATPFDDEAVGEVINDVCAPRELLLAPTRPAHPHHDPASASRLWIATWVVTFLHGLRSSWEEFVSLWTPWAAPPPASSSAGYQPLDLQVAEYRWVAEVAGRVVAFTQANPVEDGANHPRTFWFTVYVHPSYRCQGIGTALYDHLLGVLQPLEPGLLRAAVRDDYRDDWTRGLRFLESRGFRETWRVRDAYLDVRAFDAAPYAGLEDSLRAESIQISTFLELAADPERDQKLFDLYSELLLDVPAELRGPLPAYDEFRATWLEAPAVLPDAHFVVVHEGAYIGVTSLWARGKPTDLWHAMTGVRHPYRRRGIARALKARTIAYALSRGATILRTSNPESATAMLALNKELGFVDLVLTVAFTKVVADPC